MKPRSFIARMSPKTLANTHGGKVPSSTITGPKKQVKKVNVARQAKRVVSYRKGLAAYKKSFTYMIVKARADGRCEWIYREFFIGGNEDCAVRCPETEGLQHHHLRYSLRFGGNELPTDMLVLCKSCHRREEAAKPAKNRFARTR